MVRVGIVGVGGMGSFHARTLASMSGVTVAAVSDPYEPNATALRDELGAEVADDPFALIGSGDVDALVIASPDDTHAELSVAAIEHGVPTLCEKPLASNVDDARRVMATEIAAGRRLVQLGFMREYDLAHRQVQHELEALGTIDHLRAVHRNANRHRRALHQIVVQSMIHDVHSVRFLTGAEITSVRASGSGAEAGSFRHVVALCRLDDGAHAVLEFDDGGFAYEVTVEVLTRTGDALTGPPMRAIRRADGSESTHLGSDWFGWFADAYRFQDEAWVASVRDGRPTGPTIWDGLTAQRVVDAIMRSLDGEATVDVPAEERPALYA
jgi:myo-inositol 2-dehydrogenase/D-chiro-inositol 1-dehydrogenase